MTETPDVKRELRQIRTITKLIASNKRQIEELEYLKTSVSSPAITGMPKGKGYTKSDKLESIIVKIDKLEEDIRDNTEKLVKAKRFWLTEIDKLDYEDQLLIKLRYFEDKDWSDVARIMNYSKSQIHRNHGEILRKMRLNETK